MDPANREEFFMLILQRLHRRWRLIIMAPLIYFLLGLVVKWRYFDPRHGGEGFLPLSGSVATILLFAGGIFVVLLWYLLSRFRIMHAAKLSESKDSPQEFLARALQYQMREFFLCDLAATPGIFLFFLDGELPVLFAFVVASSLLYLRILPTGKLLGQAMFRPDQM